MKCDLIDFQYFFLYNTTLSMKFLKRFLFIALILGTSTQSASGLDQVAQGILCTFFTTVAGREAMKKRIQSAVEKFHVELAAWGETRIGWDLTRIALDDTLVKLNLTNDKLFEVLRNMDETFDAARFSFELLSMLLVLLICERLYCFLDKICYHIKNPLKARKRLKRKRLKNKILN